MKFFISQAKYVKEMLKKFEIDKSKPIATPLVVDCELSIDDKSLEADQKNYRSTIGGQLYLTTSRPYLMQVVYLATIFQANLRQSRDQKVKRIFQVRKRNSRFRSLV